MLCSRDDVSCSKVNIYNTAVLRFWALVKGKKHRERRVKSGEKGWGKGKEKEDAGRELDASNGRLVSSGQGAKDCFCFCVVRGTGMGKKRDEEGSRRIRKESGIIKKVALTICSFLISKTPLRGQRRRGRKGKKRCVGEEEEGRNQTRWRGEKKKRRDAWGSNGLRSLHLALEGREGLTRAYDRKKVNRR